MLQLPLLQVDPDVHFTKFPRHPKEIRNLIVCQRHPRIVQLLGRSANHDMVFGRLPSFISVAPFYLGSVQGMKEALMQLIDRLSFLHSKGIIHWDLHVNNLLLNAKNEIVICDLEAKLANPYCRTPELYVDNPTYTSKMDIYAMGRLIWSMYFQNTPREKFLAEFLPPPELFATIYQACLLKDPAEHPSLMQVREMVTEIQVLE
ncbi:hypothetical protein M422DRAFT_50154 [Sphaerobolus stellatus SS14]|uniref:Protein kinase domain-containing protein n=1 Tax=Sphaerobolus stellatus (strain SS14) TaxID=990650 RepID=A0A0C9VKA7_SPHS4|nr:hypothetical protein M422DRAFT_50154 [Sphaerobolus stellatus SS14]